MNVITASLLWLVLTAAGLLVSALPRRWELWLGPRLGRLMLALDPKRWRVARENMQRCLPELGAQGWDRLLRQNYEHYGLLALELLHMFSPIPGHYHRYVHRVGVVDGIENWKAARQKGKGTIIVSGHFANWEAFGLAASHGIRIVMATRPLKPAWLNAKIESSRLSIGVRTAYGKRILPILIKQLKLGQDVGFVMDQYAPPPMGVPARFFGAIVDTQAAVGLLAQRTGAAIIPAFQRRDEQGVLHYVFEPELQLSQEQLADSAKSAEALAAQVERWIRQTPAQWLWVHRRFKNAVWPG